MPKITSEQLRSLRNPEYRTGKHPDEVIPVLNPAASVQKTASTVLQYDTNDVLHVAKQPRKTVLLVTPFMAEDLAKGASYARFAMRAVQDSLSKNEAPLASHLLFYEVLNTNNQIERDLGLICQLSWVKDCDLVAVYIDRGMTDAMKKVTAVAQLRNKKIEYRTINAFA